MVRERRTAVTASKRFEAELFMRASCDPELNSLEIIAGVLLE